MIANDCINLANIVFHYAMPNLLPDGISATTATGVDRGCGGCGPHRAALARGGGKRAKIVFKNSRENSDCIISYVFACNKNKALQLQRVPILPQYPGL